jgi:hypothetical protein
VFKDQQVPMVLKARREYKDRKVLPVRMESGLLRLHSDIQPVPVARLLSLVINPPL